jgi:hypothetical protein
MQHDPLQQGSHPDACCFGGGCDLTHQYILEMSRIVISSPYPAASPHTECTPPAIDYNSSSQNERSRKGINFTSVDDLR